MLPELRTYVVTVEGQPELSAKVESDSGSGAVYNAVKSHKLPGAYAYVVRTDEPPPNYIGRYRLRLTAKLYPWDVIG